MMTPEDLELFSLDSTGSLCSLTGGSNFDLFINQSFLLLTDRSFILKWENIHISFCGTSTQHPHPQLGLCPLAITPINVWGVCNV
jgi:hypothetical protein